MDEILERSKEIAGEAITEYGPYAIVLMMSGGEDSLTAFYVARALGIEIDYVIHGNTRTGIPQTTEYVRDFVQRCGVPYIEADAGDAYEEYVLRKGFFGKGRSAHSYAYHVCKATAFRKAVSRNIRKGKHGRNILLLNGARLEESDNRSENLSETTNVDPAAKRNIWVNVIHHWTKINCVNFLRENDAFYNPVTKLLHRSGECMCGTMQSQREREEAAYWFPQWGEWLNDLERRVREAGFTWGWGENISDYHLQKKRGQLELFEDWTPMCRDCVGNRR